MSQDPSSAQQSTDFIEEIPASMETSLPQEGLTVRAFRDDESFRLAQAGEKGGVDELLIDNGNYRLIDTPK